MKRTNPISGKLIFFLWLLASGVANAVSLGANGVGQVLIVPYYNVENGNQTIFSITNVTDQAKAVKVYIREADNGQPVLGFNLYLSPYDVWIASIQDDGNSGARIMTYDSSCTVPAFTFGQGVGLRSMAYQNDGGDTDADRTREGSIEFIEMGVLASGSAEALAVLHGGSGVPANCTLLADNWQPGGKWDTDPTTSMEAPTGRLKADASIVNAGAGYEYEVPATVLDNFANVSLHANPGEESPTLASASPVSTMLIASADDLPVYNDQWGTARGVDAVSAVLMKQQLMGGFSVNPAVETETDWVVTFPTKRFYTQNSATAPFTSVFGSNGACEVVAATAWDREEQSSGTQISLCYVANVINFGSSDILKAVRTKTSLAPGITTGWASLEFYQSMTTPDGFSYTGLPAIGFALKRAGNGWVGIPYSSVAPLTSPPMKGSRRVFIQAGQAGINSVDGYGNEVTFVSTDKIVTQGQVTVGAGKIITFMTPVVILNKTFGVADGGVFRVVSTNP